MVGLGTGKAALVVSAPRIVPIAAKFPARGSQPEGSLDLRPRCRSMPLHVRAGDPVGDALVAERRKKPIEDRWRVATGDGLTQTCLADFGVDLVEKGHQPRQSADRPYQKAGAL